MIVIHLISKLLFLRIWIKKHPIHPYKVKNHHLVVKLNDGFIK